MIAAALFRLFDFISTNKTAQWIAGGLAIVFSYLAWLTLFHDPKVRKAANAKAQIKAEKQATKAIKEVKERTDETVQKAAEARAAVPDGALADELPDDLQSILFDD
jgi:type II secretory pathway component PulM